MHRRLAFQASLVLVATLALCATQAPRPAGLMSYTVAGQVLDYDVRPGDTIRSLAARFAVDEAVIAADNGIEHAARLTPGLRLRLDGRHIVPAIGPIDIVVNIPQRLLFHGEGGVFRAMYPVAVGSAGWPTPAGDFVVVEKKKYPTWTVPRSIQEEMRRAGKPVLTTVPPGPGNPLGDHFIRLSIPSIGLHGTSAASSIYRFTTHGCIRLHPDDIADLFPRVEVGARGRLVYEPVLLAETAAGVFLEAHPDPYRRGPIDAIGFVRALADSAGITGRIDWKTAAEVIASRDGVARRVAPRADTF